MTIDVKKVSFILIYIYYGYYKTFNMLSFS